MAHTRLKLACLVQVPCIPEALVVVSQLQPLFKRNTTSVLTEKALDLAKIVDEAPREEESELKIVNTLNSS